MKNKPIFLDRDGVINVDISPYVTRVNQLEIFPWTVESLKRLHDAGYDIYIISNQQGVAKGLMTQTDLEQINDKIQSMLRPHGFEIKHFYYATAHHSEDHPWRKPKSGMLFQAQKDHSLEIEKAFFIGDKETDLQCATGGGCRFLLVESGVTASGESECWKVKPEAEFPTLVEAVDYILSSK